MVIKRDGTREEFSPEKVANAMRKAYNSVGKEMPEGKRYMNALLKLVNGDEDVKVEAIQDAMEKYLMDKKEYDVAKSFIIYREKHKHLRDCVRKKEEFINRYKKSKNTANATIDDNSNVANKNIGVLNAEIHKEENIETSRGMIMHKLKALYPDFNARQYLNDLESHIIYKNDESSFAPTAPYCVAASMYPFLNGGIKGLGGLSAKPKNLDSFCGMYINLIFALSGQFAGAVATPEALLVFNYFAQKEFGTDYWQHSDEFYKIGSKFRKLLNETHFWCKNLDELRNHDFGNDGFNSLRDEIVRDATRPLTKEEMKEFEEAIASADFKQALENGDDTSFVPNPFPDSTRTIGSTIHQCFQQIVYSINQPAASRGQQSAFVNFAYYDKPFFDSIFNGFRFPDGRQPDWDSLNWLQKDFMMWFNEERLKCVITFPVESFALIYRDGKFLDEENAKFVAEEYARGHSFFTYISDTADSLSSCCRLKNKIQVKEFNYTNGNMSVQTGSKSVITLNLNRITQNAFNTLVSSGEYNKETTTDASLFNRIADFIDEVLERVYKYHNAYNELLWDNYNAGLLPAYSNGFIALNKQYLTIGLNGLNEAAEFLGMQCNDNERYALFCQTIFSRVKANNQKHKTKKTNFNTEQIPAESLAVKNYNWDKADGYWVPEDRNLYASYIYIPSDKNLTILDKIKLHGRNYIGDYLDGGSAAHINLNEHLTKEQYYNIMTYAAKEGCQYFTFNIPNTECNDCGFIAKTPFDVCPKCGSKHVTMYTRIIGYLTAIKNWSQGRQIEHKSRVYSTGMDETGGVQYA
jgi:ribonucleoside-triphosphate reductase